MNIGEIIIFFKERKEKNLETILEINQILKSENQSITNNEIQKKEKIIKTLFHKYSSLYNLEIQSIEIYPNLNKIKSNEILEILFYLKKNRKYHFALSKSNILNKNNYKFLFGYSK